MTQFVDGDYDAKPDVEKHPSFGMISVIRTSSNSRLFGVDYPQGHSVKIRIETGKVRREFNEEKFFSEELVGEIEMSEVQYARMLSNPNTMGVPCTIRYRRTGPLERVEDPPEHMGTDKTARDEARKLAHRVAGNFDHVQAKLKEFVAGKSPTKSQIGELLMWVEQAQQGIRSDMPFLVKQVEEGIERQVNDAKTELDAYVQNQLAELGRQEVSKRLNEGGVTIRLKGGFAPKLEGPESE